MAKSRVYHRNAAARASSALIPAADPHIKAESDGQRNAA
jgi:hypothetical protein